MKHRRAPPLCERCEQKIDDRTGWGVMMICAIQAQPEAPAALMDERAQSLIMCGYCFHELALWFAPDEATANEDH